MIIKYIGLNGVLWVFAIPGLEGYVLCLLQLFRVWESKRE